MNNSTHSRSQNRCPAAAAAGITTYPTDPSPGTDQLASPPAELLAIASQQPVTQVVLPNGEPGWIVTGPDVIREVLANPAFSRAEACSPARAQSGVAALAAGTLMGMDPPDHTRLRTLVAKAFTPRRVEAIRPHVAQIVAELIDGMLERDRPVDLVQNFSLPLPTRVICELLGVPFEDRSKFHEWSDAMTGSGDRDQEIVMAGFVDMAGYIADLIAAKRTRPADDLLTALIAARDGHDRLSEDELVQLAITILVAGHETTANHINLSLLALLDNPAELTRLRADLDRVSSAVEELLRYVQLGTPRGPLSDRVATADVDLGGVTIGAGDLVIPLLSVANRAPVKFHDPHRLDLTRSGSRHLTFGWGPHRCLGAQLARVELQEAFRGLLDRLQGLRIAVPAPELRFKEQSPIYSLVELPVTWDD